MCDPSPEKVIVREVAVPFVTYERHCDNLRNPPPGFDFLAEHNGFLAALYEMQPKVPVDYYGYTAFSPYDPKQYRLGGTDYFYYQGSHYYPPGNNLKDCWVILGIAWADMVRPWGMGKFECYNTVSVRSAIGLFEEPTDELVKYHVSDKFPFKEAHMVEITPDNTYFNSAPRVSAQKRAKVMSYLIERGVRFSTSWDNHMLFNVEMYARHPIDAPFYANVIVDDASVIEELKAI